MADLTAGERAELGSVSIVIPARNEVGAIEDVVRVASEHADEVVVVDDGSTDGTGGVAAAAGARVVVVSPGRGKGHALRQGVREASGETLVMLDGDGQDDPADTPRLLAALHDGADLVIGTRFAGTMVRGAVAPLDRAGNRLLTELLNALYGVRLTDTQAGFRAIRRRVWETLPLRAEGFDVETEVLVRALQAKATVREVSVSRRPRQHGQRVLNRARDGLAILACMLRLRFAR